MATDPLWPIRTPQDNHTILLAGTGTVTTLTNMAAWLTQLATHELSFASSTLNGVTTAASFVGLGGTGSATAGSALNTALQLLADWVLEKPPLCEAAATAYETAVSTMIPAPVCDANRMEELADQQINPWVWGALTPRIADLNLEYFGEHWPHNASAGVAYGMVLTALTASLAIPPPVAPISNPAAAAANSSAAIAQTAAQGAAGDAMRSSEQASQAVGQGASSSAGDTTSQLGSFAGQLGSVVQPLTGMFQMPLQMGQQALSAGPQAFSSLSGMFGNAMKGPDVATEAANVKAPGSSGGAGINPASLGGGAGGLGGGGYPGAGMTNYTRPASSFGDSGGRASGLRTGLLEPVETRAPGTGSTMSGGAMPLSPASMLNRGSVESQKNDVTRARVVADGGRRDSRRDL